MSAQLSSELAPYRIPVTLVLPPDVPYSRAPNLGVLAHQHVHLGADAPMVLVEDGVAFGVYSARTIQNHNYARAKRFDYDY